MQQQQQQQPDIADHAVIANNVNDYSRSNTEVANRVTVYGSSRAVEGTPEWDRAHRVGYLAAQRGMDIVSGGYVGTMTAVSQGAAAGRDDHLAATKKNDEQHTDHSSDTSNEAFDPRIHGCLCPGQFPDRATQGNQYLTDSVDGKNMCHRVHYLTSMSRYFVVLPGTMGTMMEISSIWCLWYIHPSRLPMEDRPVMIAFRDPWEPVCEAIIKGLSLPDSQHVNAIRYVDTPEEVYEIIDADRRKKDDL